MQNLHQRSGAGAIANAGTAGAGAGAGAIANAGTAGAGAGTVGAGTGIANASCFGTGIVGLAFCGTAFFDDP